jgi:hypothetical protein
VFAAKFVAKLLTEPAISRICLILDFRSFITRTSTSELTFVAKGRNITNPDVAMPMIPLYQVMEQAYSVYFKTVGDTEVK